MPPKVYQLTESDARRNDDEGDIDHPRDLPGLGFLDLGAGADTSDHARHLQAVGRRRPSYWVLLGAASASTCPGARRKN